MAQTIDDFLDDLPQGQSVNVLVGENGAGKSRLLREIAQHEREKRNVFAIANTVFDRFLGVRGIRRISVGSGRDLPQKLLKKAIIQASRDSLVRLRTLADTLEYCDYSSEVGLALRFKRSTDKPLPQGAALQQVISNMTTLVLSDPRFLGQKRLVIEELQDLLQVVLIESGYPQDGILWLKFNDNLLRSSINEMSTRILVWEPYLVSAGVIERIDLLLKSRNGRAVEILMKDASSGQLTLIACLVSLTVSVKPGSVVLIDEPENSLHPLWQREYVERLLTLLNYRDATIFIATHAPILVSGAQLIENADVKVFRINGGSLDLVARQLQPGEKTSLEETVFESFGTVTPANHFVSESLSKQFAKLRAGTTTAEEISVFVEQMKKGSFDEQQSDFLDKIVDMAREVEDQRDRFGDASA